MYRIISSGQDTSVITGSKASGVFGMSASMHRLPRRYKYLESALKAAKRTPGILEIMDDERNIVAIVKNGVQLAVAA